MGMLLAAAVDLYSDGGWSLDLSQPVLDRALFHIDNGYYIPALRVTGLIAKTNVASNTAFRGFGGPQGCSSWRRSSTGWRGGWALRPKWCAGRNLYRGNGEDEHDALRPGDRRQPPADDLEAGPGGGGICRPAAARSTGGTGAIRG